MSADSLSGDDQERLEELLDEYEDAVANGRSFSASQACETCPHLLPVLNEQIRLLTRIQDLQSLPPAQWSAFDDDVSLERRAQVGQYKLLELIGQGGMGEVWLAEQQEPIRRKVAIKMIRGKGHSRTVLGRFAAERQALAMMEHPNIAKILDAGTSDDGEPFFVMELVRGLPITDYCDQQRCTPKQRLQLFLRVCEAVQHAHQKGIIHRDIKPSNVLVADCDGKPVPQVIDFGLAKATDSRTQLSDRTVFTEFGNVLGTVLYMSPEQAELDQLDIDTRCDIYSLGVLLYQLLTGSTPIEPATAREQGMLKTLALIREEDPPTPSTRLDSSPEQAAAIAGQRNIPLHQLQNVLKGDLDWIVMKSLSKERQRRYATASDFAGDITAFLRDEPVGARPPSTRYRIGKFCRRHKAATIAATGVAVTLLAAVVVSASFAYHANAQKVLAVGAAAKEKAAKELAEGRLAQLEESNEILSSVFESLDPKRINSSDGDLRKALVDQLDEAVAKLKAGAYGDELGVARMQSRIAVSLLNLGEPAKAEPLLESALEVFRRRLEPDHQDAVLCMTNLASLKSDRGKYEAALQIYESTYERLLAKRGPDHWLAISVLHNVALTRSNMGEPQRAIALLEKTFARQKKLKGEEDYYTLKFASDLALAYAADGDTDRALTLLRETSETQQRVFGADSMDALETLNKLATLHMERGEVVTALPLLERVLDGQRRHLGPDHPETLGTLNNLAALYWKAKRLDKSIPLFEEAFEIQRAKQGAEHPQTLILGANLGVNYKDAGRIEDALPYLEEAYRAADEIPALAWVELQLLDAYLKAGKAKQAATVVQRRVADVRARVPAGSIELANHLGRYAVKLHAVGAFQESESMLRESLEIIGKHAPDSWQYWNVSSMLGAMLLNQKKYEQAEPLLVSAHEGLKRQESQLPESAREFVAVSLQRLIDLYEQWGKEEEAKKWRQAHSSQSKMKTN